MVGVPFANSWNSMWRTSVWRLSMNRRKSSNLFKNFDRVSSICVKQIVHSSILNILLGNSDDFKCYLLSRISTLFCLMYASSSFAFCYHSVNMITYGLAQSDHIRRRLLYHTSTLGTENRFNHYSTFIPRYENFILLINYQNCSSLYKLKPRNEWFGWLVFPPSRLFYFESLPNLSPTTWTH